MTVGTSVKAEWVDLFTLATEVVKLQGRTALVSHIELDEYIKFKDIALLCQEFSSLGAIELTKIAVR